MRPVAKAEEQRRGRPVRVRRDEVIAAATEMLADDGASGFNMRKLADRLGASTAAVYYHFPGKAQLFIAVLSARAEELPRPRLPVDPRERLVAVVTYLIDVLHRMPWAAELLVGGESFGRAAMWILDEFVKAARELGATDPYAGYMYAVVWRFVLGELMMRRADDERSAATTDPRPRWDDLITPDDLLDLPDAQRTVPIWDDLRAAYRSDVAVAHLIDGLLSGIC